MKQINPYRMFVGSFIPNWLMLQKEITPGMKLVYARLCQFAGENGECYPSVTTISRETGIGESQVKDNLKKLKDLKLIESTRRGLGKTNVYIFLEHKWMQLSREPESRLSVGAESRPSVQPESRLQRGSVKEDQLRDKKITPLTPQGEIKSKPKFTIENYFIKIETFLAHQGQLRMLEPLRDNLEHWFEERKERRKPLSARATGMMIKKLVTESNLDYKVANSMIETAIANNYQGIFTVNGNGNGKSVNWFNFKPKLGDMTPDNRKVISSISGGFFQLDDKTYLKWTGKLWVNVDGQGRGV